MNPYEKLTTRADLLAATLPEKQQEKFRKAYLEQKGDLTLAEQQLTETKISKTNISQLHFIQVLADVTYDSPSLISSIRKKKISNIAGLASGYSTEKLEKLITAKDIPAEIPGKSAAERKRNYATAIMKRLYQQAPSAVLSRMLKEDQLPVKDPAVRKAMLDFFEQQPEFDIRKTSVNSVLNSHNASLKRADPMQRGEVVNELKSLQRTVAMTNTPEILSGLMNANLSSAHDVVKQPMETFVKNYAEKLGGEDAAIEVYERAANISTRNEYALSAMRDMINGVQPAAISGNYSPEERREMLLSMAEASGVKLNWESLFGNADLCECDECRSVYSPAAYLVELLQYLRNNNLDPEKATSDPEDISGTTLERLFRRRPDIGNLELTCENTNVALPYIDLVNEIMESFVMHLPEYEEDGNTGLDTFNVREESSQELLAVPQHVNYSAYKRLQEAVYPFTLPFHQPLAASRLYLGILGTSRDEVMRVFRSTASRITPKPKPRGKITGTAAVPPLLLQLALDRAADAETIKLSKEEYVILTKQDFYGKAYYDTGRPQPMTDQEYHTLIGLKPLYAYYGYSNLAEMTTRLKEVKAGFMVRAGVAYTELVELLGTQFINQAYPKGKALYLLSRIPYSYRYLQSLIQPDQTSPGKFSQIINLLKTVFTDPADIAEVQNWVTDHFERLGKIIVLESHLQPGHGYYYSSGLLSGNSYWFHLRDIADDCDISRVTLQHLDGSDLSPEEFDRIHRFIRLWRKMGWTIEETDRAIAGLGTVAAGDPLKTDITSDFIQQLASITQLVRSTELPLSRLQSFWTDIDTYGDRSLYRKLFLGHHLVAADPVFEADAFGNYLTGNVKISNHIPVLTAALQIRDIDIAALRAYLSMPDALNLPNVSALFRYATLARLLKLQITELLEIIQLIGNPFTNASSTLYFLDQLENIATADFSPAQLSYIVSDTDNGKIGSSAKQVQTLARLLSDGLRKIDKDHPLVPENEMDQEFLRGKLELIFDKEVTRQVIGLLEGTNVYSDTIDAGLTIAIPEALRSSLSYDPVKGLISVIGILSAEQQTSALALSANAGYKDMLSQLFRRPEIFFNDTLYALFANQQSARAIILAADNAAGSASIKTIFTTRQYLPFLRNKLSLQLIVQTLASSLKLNAEITELLLTEVLRAENGTEMLIKDFEKVKTLESPAGTYWEGYLSPLSDDLYTLVMTVPHSNIELLLDGEMLQLWRTENDPLHWQSHPVRLNGGQLYELKIRGLQGDLTGLSWKTPTIPRTQIPEALLFSKVAGDLFFRAHRKLQKAAMVINGFELDVKELKHFHKRSQYFDQINFNQLTLLHWNRLFDYKRLRNKLPGTDTTLPAFFTWAQNADPASLAEGIASLTGWSLPVIIKLISPASYNLVPADFANEKALLKLFRAIEISSAITVDPDKLFAWAKPEADFDTVRQAADDIRSAIQGRYTQEQWEEVIKPLHNKLREEQQRALIAYLLVQSPVIQWAETQNIPLTPDALFEFFLIDVQMGTAQQTSRVRQALSSIQTYVQRCFLGLEKDVPVTELDNNRWEWMQQYRTWEANRKVFLYPENWVEPELRDNKSPIFRELEASLLQNDLNRENVENAVHQYLQKLEEISRLDACAVYQEYLDDKLTQKKMHIFSRTQNAPFTYYYRYYDNLQQYWSPWDKIMTDIQSLEDDREGNIINKNKTEGVNLIPVVWNSRLLLFWPVITKKQITNPSNGSKTFYQVAETTNNNLKNLEYREIKLAWSEYKNGKWTTRQTSSCVVNSPALTKTANIPDIYFVQNVQEDYIKINAYNIGGILYENAPKLGAFLFKSGNMVSATDADDYKPYLHRPAGVTTQYMNFYGDNNPRLDLTDDPFPEIGTIFNRPVKDYKITRSLQQQYNNETNRLYPMVYQEEFSKQNENGRVFVGIERNYSGNSKLLYIQEFHHPYAGVFMERFTTGGLSGLLSQLTQSSRKFSYNIQDYKIQRGDYIGSPDNGTIDFGEYQTKRYNEESLPFSVYNWELFFHVPLLIADRLSKSQQYEEAKEWFQYIFDPLSRGPENDVRRYWQFLPFKTDMKETLHAIFNGLEANKPDENINRWRNNPFNPHLIARSRPTAYMKTVVMKYLDNLIAGADQLYRQNTLETINQATMYYVMAGHILGPRPQTIPKRGKIRPETYNSLRSKWDAFSNAIVEMEQVFPYSNQVIAYRGGGVYAPFPGTSVFGVGASLYFGIPSNPKLLGYWDTVADRLFKIRHSLNIDGVVQQLPLFEPPIDPGILVQATSMGLSLSSVVSDLNAPMSYYRFHYLIQKALELCAEVKGMGSLLLSVLEKKDGEGLARLRASHETNLLNLLRQVRIKQLEDASAAVELIGHSRNAAAGRLKHYTQLLGLPDATPALYGTYRDIEIQQRKVLDYSGMKLIDLEKEDMDKTYKSVDLQNDAGLLDKAASIAAYIPSANAHATPFGVGVALGFGGPNISSALGAVSRFIQSQASKMSFEASMAGKKAAYYRQRQDWMLQANIAGREIMQIDRQMAAANIRVAIAAKELENQDVQINQSKETEDFLRNKYTSQDLYQWMEGQVKTVYYQAYQLAYDMAKKAEKSYRFERGETATDFIQFGYWNGSHDGLMAGEQLALAIKQMERAYLENNKREYEITRHISLAQLDPMAMIGLRETGTCEFSLTESLFDMDFAGHYMRRIKSIAISIPCVTGPYTSVNATLTLLRDTTRIKLQTDGQYAERTDGADPRFAHNFIASQSIAASSGQQDNGMFELSFRDERYLPFEGAGAVSRWKLELPAQFRQFDYDSIADVILHMRYTAKDGGNTLKAAALEYLDDFFEGSDKEQGLSRLFSLRHEFSGEWYRFLHPLQGEVQQLTLAGLQERFPYFTRNKRVKGKEVTGIDILLRGKKETSLKLNGVQMNPASALGDLVHLQMTEQLPSLSDTWIIVSDGDTITTEDLQDAWLVVNYSLIL